MTTFQLPDALMPTSLSHPTRSSPLLLAAGHFMGVAVGGLAGLGAANLASWATTRDAVRAAGLASIAVLVAACLGLALIVVGQSGGPQRLANMIVGAGVGRLLASLALGVALFLIAGPEAKTFWTSFLVASLVCLIVETVWGMGALKRVSNQSPRRSPAAGASGAVE